MDSIINAFIYLNNWLTYFLIPTCFEKRYKEMN
jgi:hypothetical protein